MEDIRKILQQSDISLDSTDSDSDVSYESLKFKQTDLYTLRSAQESENATKGKRGGKERERLPTRRPDPNIYNRNALLARENRRKKKEHLETMEKDLADARKTNNALLKALKRQVKHVRRLEQEKSYFKSIVTNQTEILNLVTSLNSRIPPSNSVESPNQALVSPADSLGYSSRERSSSSYDPEPLSITFESSDNGRETAAQYSCGRHSPMSSSNFLDNFFTEFEPESTLNADWNELLKDEFCLNETFVQKPSAAVADTVAHICDEHSYVSVRDNSTNDAGVCLHITRGKVSLEFCPSCHWNACRTPPTQLLQEDAAA